MASKSKKSASADGVATPEKLAPVIYIGPTISQISLLNHCIFRGGLSAECEKLLTVVPGAKHLFVPTADFAAATSRLSDKTSVESVMYLRVVSALKEIK